MFEDDKCDGKEQSREEVQGKEGEEKCNFESEEQVGLAKRVVLE